MILGGHDATHTYLSAELMSLQFLRYVRQVPPSSMTDRSVWALTDKGERRVKELMEEAGDATGHNVH